MKITHPTFKVYITHKNGNVEVKESKYRDEAKKIGMKLARLVGKNYARVTYPA